MSMDTYVRDLAFPETEYAVRLAYLRTLMAARRIEVLLVFTPENVTYLTGYESIGYSSYQCLIVPTDADPLLLVREMELGVARSTTWLSDFATSGDTDDPVTRTRDVLSEWGWLTRRIGIEETGPFLTARTYGRLRQALAAAEVVDGSGLVETGRRIKSAAEIDYARRACRLVEAGMAQAVAAVRPGATENQVSVAAYGAMVGGGSGFLAADPIVTSGPRSGIAHTTFGNRAIAPGDTVLIELGACQRRYFGALMRTAVIGQPSAEVSRLAEVVKASLNAAIEAIRPGVAAGVVDEACRGVIERAGCEPYFRKRTGYSIGLAFAPDWGEGHIVSLRRDDPTPLEPGMVFHMPPALRVFQRCCVGMSETVLVTEHGCEVLTHYPRELLVI
jgi:Xaa-Pro dipeptidase